MRDTTSLPFKSVSVRRLLVSLSPFYRSNTFLASSVKSATVFFASVLRLDSWVSFNLRVTNSTSRRMSLTGFPTSRRKLSLPSIALLSFSVRRWRIIRFSLKLNELKKGSITKRSSSHKQGLSLKCHRKHCFSATNESEEGVCNLVRKLWMNSTAKGKWWKSRAVMRWERWGETPWWIRKEASRVSPFESKRLTACL